MTVPGDLRTHARAVPVDEPLVRVGYDYADAFELRMAEPDARPAEQWARAALERAPVALRRIIVVAHRYVLRFDLGPRSSPDHVLGWTIVTSTPEVIHLEASSPLVRAIIVGRKLGPTRLVLTTAVRYERPMWARLVWWLVAPVHRRVARFLLPHAAATTEISPGSAT